MESRKIGIRFCGGCNPGYDRKKVTEKIAAAFPDIVFENVNAAGHYMAVLVVVGCPSACANIQDLTVPEDRLIYIRSFADLVPTKEKIREFCETEDDSDTVRRLNNAEVREILPHREPMLLIDSVSWLKSGREITAEYTVDPDHAVFQGHFPDNPVFPGVLSIEAMAQAADIMMLTLDEYRGKIPVLFEVHRAECRSMIRPGMKLEIRAALIREKRAFGRVEARCQIFCEEKLSADAEITLIMK